jgi:hypothetical protein
VCVVVFIYTKKILELPTVLSFVLFTFLVSVQ